MARTADRGYGARHQKLRKTLNQFVATGNCKCVRCGELIAANEHWDLGHDDHDRSLYTGPEHVKCNRATAGRNKRDPEARPNSQW